MIKSYAELKEENKWLKEELDLYIRRIRKLENIINEYNDIFNKNKIILARYVEEEKTEGGK